MNIRICKRTYPIFVIVTRTSIALLLIYSVLPHRFASNYDYVQPDDILDTLVVQTTRNISLQQQPACDYEDIIETNRYMYLPKYRQVVLNSEEIHAGGEYYPDDCRPKFSTAIIVPYRQRESQLNDFLIYMHNYLRQQRIHYRIFLVEQYDKKPFNRAKLFNIGAVIAAQYDFPCLVLHDVDLLPFNAGQMYACSHQPRHMCSALDDFRFHLPYRGLFGGVISIRTEQFRFINGMSNLYEGWGGEDDDLFVRLDTNSINIIRFAPTHSEYTMMHHKKEQPNKWRLSLLRTALLRINIDGLNSLDYKLRETRIHSLFTHILAET